MTSLRFLTFWSVSSFILQAMSALGRAEEPTSLPEIVQYGTMHEAIGKQQFHERVDVLQLTQKPHFFGIGALANLAGEISVWDGQVVTTSYSAVGELTPSQTSTSRVPATMLAGARVAEWQSQEVASSVPANKFDDFVSEAAKQAGLATTKPFVFTIEGEFIDVHLHVIRGACPIHARIHRVELPEAKRPFEGDFDRISGRMLGVYAEGSAGKLTHPSTATHRHLVWKPAGSKEWLTGHIEKAGISAGSLIRFPATSHD